MGESEGGENGGRAAAPNTTSLAPILFLFGSREKLSPTSKHSIIRLPNTNYTNKNNIPESDSIQHQIWKEQGRTDNVILFSKLVYKKNNIYN